MLLYDRIWWPRLPCPRQWGRCENALLQAPRCCKGWDIESDSVGWNGKSSPPPHRNSGDVWVPTIALVAAVWISAARKAPVGVRIVGLLSVLVLGLVVRDQVLQGDFSEIDRLVEGFFRKRRRRNKSVDNVAVSVCLNKLEGVVLAMKARGKHEDEHLVELERSLVSLKRLLLLDTGHAHVETDPRPSGDESRSFENVKSVEHELKQQQHLETVLCPSGASFDSVRSVEHQQTSPQVPEKIMEQDNDQVELDEMKREPVKAEDDEQTSKDKNEQVLNSVLEQADELLQNSQSWLNDGTDNGLTSADTSLARCIHLLNQAVETNPTNLVAVGMLANALLLRGQVKLKAVQRLDAAEVTLSKDEAVKLQRVSEGCEELLVEAGKTYRRALLIDRKDFRALHNWGVSLSSRAELLCIKEATYEETSADADKLYLAAIDKFEAVVGLDQDLAAPALVNWAMAVRNRSRLNNRSPKQRLTLLLLARRLLLDAAKLDPSQLQVQADVSRCELEEEIRRLQRHRRRE